FLDGKNQFDAGVGIYGSHESGAFGGFTINNLVLNRLNDISGRTTDEGFNFTFLVGQRFQVEELNVNLTPSLMIRDVQGAPFMMDFNLQAGFLEDQFIAGLSYRYLGAVGILLGTKLNGFQLYYNFDLGFGGFQQYNSGSHEFTVGYSISRGSIQEAQRRNAAEEKLR
ncbi:MAG: type IX secretion system membrane protein PorP/SprF, partial [Bacteroidota bacterium]